MPGHPLLTDSPTVPVSTLATLMAHADDLVEAELGLLAANPVSTPELIGRLVSIRDLTHANHVGVLVMLGTALQKLATCRWEHQEGER